MCILDKLEVVDPLAEVLLLEKRKPAHGVVDIADAPGRQAGLLHQLQCVGKHNIGDKELRSFVLVGAILQRLPALEDARAHFGRPDRYIVEPGPRLRLPTGSMTWHRLRSMTKGRRLVTASHVSSSHMTHAA